MRNTPSALAVLALLVGTAGCTDDSADDADPTVASNPATSSAPTAGAPTGAPTSTSTANPEASPPPFPADTLPDDGSHGSGNGLAGVSRLLV